MLSDFKFPKELNLLFLSILLSAIAVGINLVTFPTILNLHGVDSAKIGFAFTADVFGGILISFFLSKIVARFGIIKTIKIATFGYAAIIATIFYYRSYFLWLGLALAMGALWFSQMIIRQSWINILIDNKRRGIALGIFSMLLSFGIAIGPLVVKFSGAKNYLSFLISAALSLASFFCLKLIEQKGKIIVSSERIGLKEFFKNNPRIFLARFFLDFQTYILLTLTVIFGIKIGLSSEAAGLLITAYMASGFFDVWVGFALKKMKPYQLINVGFIGCLWCFILIIFFHKYYQFLLVSYFVFGLSIACIYVTVFKVVNDDYAKEKLVAANATFQMIGSIGSLLGSLFGGIMFQNFEALGFPISIVLSCITYLTFLVIYDKKYR